MAACGSWVSIVAVRDRNQTNIIPSGRLHSVIDTMAINKYRHCFHPYPVRHRRKVPFRPQIETPPDLVQRLLEIRNLDHEIDRYILSERDYLDLLVEVLSVNIHRSVKLEGSKIALGEAARVTRSTLLGSEPGRMESARLEIRNHVRVWTQPDRWRLPWSRSVVESLHATLLYGLDENGRPGELTRRQMVVISDKGEELFIGCPAEHVGEEVDSLINWVNRYSGAYFPVVAAAVFFHEFESIHPFEDGNGRAGRTLFHMLLENQGLPNSRFCQVEKYLLKDPDLYYRILGWTDFKESYLDLIDFFTGALLESYREAVKRLEEKDLLTHGMDETGRRLLAQARRHGVPFSVRTARAWIGGRGDQAIRSHLNDLVRRGALRATGATKSRRYVFASSAFLRASSPLPLSEGEAPPEDP